MSDLQLGLLVLGVLAVAGVLAFNKIQERRARRDGAKHFGATHRDVLLGAGGKVLAKGLVNSREHLESLIVSHEMGVAHVQDYISGLAAPVAKAEAA